MARLNRRYRKKRRNPSGEGSSRANPPLLAEIGEFVLPGFAGFAITRFGTRVAATQIGQRWPNSSWGKHAGAVASVGSFLAAWFLAHRWKWTAKYQTPLVVGSAIAAIQSIIQLYIPQLGWVIADASPELATGSTSSAVASGGGTASTLPPGMTVVNDDPNLYVYNDSYDAGRSSPATGSQQSGAAPADEYDDLAVTGADESAQNMGIFNN